MKRVILQWDPETGMSIQKVSNHYRRMARNFQNQLRICDIPERLYKRYLSVTAARNRVNSDLAQIFENSQQGDNDASR